MTDAHISSSTPLILASASAARADLLRNAGLKISVIPANVDEDAIRAALDDDDTPLPTEDVAIILGEAKALDVSAQNPGALVIAGDQILGFNDEILTKPKTIKDAYLHLSKLSGTVHRLESSIVCVLDGETIWRHVSTAHMTIRPLSPKFIETYLEQVGPKALESVGGYQLEGMGVQLFEKIEGDYFTILGLPLLPLLAFLRATGYLPT